MAPRKRTAKPRPKSPARIRKRKRRTARSHHHPELLGLCICAFGVFLACVLWVGLNGGPVPGLVTSAIGWAAYVAPVVFIPLGALIVTRSALVDVRPFRVGVSAASVGLLLALGSGHGGGAGNLLESGAAKGIGTTGATILG